MYHFQYPVISGVWTSSFALGNFLGPTFGGLLYASVGFGYTTMAFQERTEKSLLVLASSFVLVLIRKS